MLLEYAGARDAPQRAERKPQDVIEYLNKRSAALFGKRDSDGWLEHWRDISDYICPRRGTFLLKDPRKGRKVNRNLLSHVPYTAAGRFANGMNNGMTSKARQWFNLVAADDELNKLESTRRWLKRCERLISQWLAASNFYEDMPAIYLDYGLFGTPAAILMEDDQSMFRLETLEVGEYAIGRDAKGRATTLVRRCDYTTEQMVDEFGLENCSRAVQDSYRNQHYGQCWQVSHIIEPNRDMVPGQAGANGMAFRSVYWEANADKKDRFLKYKGFQENPILAPRWSGKEDYGRSLGMDALPECKQLKQAIIRKEQGKERLTVPPLTAPASLKNAGANLLPGAVNYVDSTDDKVFKSVYGNYDPRLEVQKQDIKDLEAAIEVIFKNDILYAISQMEGVQPRNVVEILERKEEKLQELGDGVGSFEGHFLVPMIGRIWAMAIRQGKLPAPPPVAENKQIKINFVGPIALALKQADIQSLERTISLIGQMAGSFPEAGDKLNVDRTIDVYADLTNAPVDIIRSDEEVAAIRQRRAAQQKQKEMMEGAPQAIERVSRGAELLSRTRAPGGGSALDQLEAATGPI